MVCDAGVIAALLGALLVMLGVSAHWIVEMAHLVQQLKPCCAVVLLLLRLLLLLLQSYGIKVGYGAGGPSSQTVKPGEPEQRKASSCC